MNMNIDQLSSIEVLQESERFLVEKVTYNGLTAVLKKAKTPEMIVNIQQELLAYEVYGLMAEDEKCPFEIATILNSGTDWVLMSYLEGQSMSDCQDGDMYLSRLASIMAFCDNKAGIDIDGARIRISHSKLAKQHMRISEKVGRLSLLDGSKASFLKQGLIEAADFYKEHGFQLQTCFVNADLTPVHVMVNGKSLAIFDFENANMTGYRFADVINMVTKIWFIDGDSQKARDFLNDFWKAKGGQSDEHSLQLQTLLYGRCIGFTDELLTEPNQFHNTSLKMNYAFARNIADVLDWAKGF